MFGRGGCVIGSLNGGTSRAGPERRSAPPAEVAEFSSADQGFWSSGQRGSSGIDPYVLSIRNVAYVYKIDTSILRRGCSIIYIDKVN